MATVHNPPNELAILRRIVDRKHGAMRGEAAREILALDFDSSDRRRMNRLAAKNRAGKLTRDEDDELRNFIHVGQMLGILKSKARRSLREGRL